MRPKQKSPKLEVWRWIFERIGKPAPPALLGVLLVSLVLARQAFAGGFSNASPMLSPRVLHTATLLPNGKVLVAGGIITNRPVLRTSSAELYDPTTGLWTATAPMSVARINHTATLLPNGRVLVAGGSAERAALRSAELYNPATGTWTNAAWLNTNRSLATAALLPNGRVLVVGGEPDNYQTGSFAELYDPLKDIWTRTGTMKTVRSGQTATVLSDGRVLVAGGSGMIGSILASAELYNPSNSTWAAVGPLNQSRRAHTATFLPNGQVLVVGGAQPRPSLATAELFDPVTARWSVLVNKLHAGRQSHTATLLPDGRLLVAGGFENTNASAVLITSAEMLDPASGQFIEGDNLITPRYLHTATLLQDGRVLLAGGWGTNGVLGSAELYVPAGGDSGTNGRPAARLYARIPTLPPGEPAPKEQTAMARVLSNANDRVSVLKWRIEEKLDEVRASATEPGYNGHPLSHWIRDVQWESSRMPPPLRPEAAAAIAHIGTNAIPFLLKWMAASSNSSFFDSGTIQAFRILGRDAGSAIPELTRLATNQPESVLRAQAHEQRYITSFGAGPLMALGGIGSDALPALVTILTNAIAPGTRLGAIDALGGMGTNAAPAVPILLRYVDDENEMVAMAAVKGLGTAGPGDPAALAVLEKIAQGSRFALRYYALEALGHFGEQAVPALVRVLGDTNNTGNLTAFNMLAFSVPTAITNSKVVAIAAEALRSPDADRREWAAYALRAIGQQASGVKPDFMSPISRQDMRFEDATNVLRRLAPELLGDNRSR